LVKAEKGDFELTLTAVFKLEKSFEETVSENIKKSFRMRVRRLRNKIRKEIDRKLKRTFVNEYTSTLYLQFEDGTAKRIVVGTSRLIVEPAKIVNNVIITGNRTSIKEVGYEIVGINEEILKIAQEITGRYCIFVTPKEEYKDEITKAVISLMNIPEKLKQIVDEFGFTPWNPGLKCNNIKMRWTNHYVTLSTFNKWKNLKFTSPNFEQRLKKLIIELS